MITGQGTLRLEPIIRARLDLDSTTSTLQISSLPVRSSIRPQATVTLTRFLTLVTLCLTLWAPINTTTQLLAQQSSTWPTTMPGWFLNRWQPQTQYLKSISLSTLKFLPVSSQTHGQCVPQQILLTQIALYPTTLKSLLWLRTTRQLCHKLSRLSKCHQCLHMKSQFSTTTVASGKQPSLHFSAMISSKTTLC